MPSCTFSMQLLTKIITVLTCLFIIVISIISLVTRVFNISNLILSIYYMIFMIILVGAEFKVMLIIKRFRLLYVHLGKAIFCVVIGGLIIQEDGFGLRAIGAAVLVGLGIYHIVLMFICKSNKSQASEVQENSARTAPTEPLQ